MDSRKFLYDNNELFQSISLPSQDLPAPALYVVGLPIGISAILPSERFWSSARQTVLPLKTPGKQENFWRSLI